MGLFPRMTMLNTVNGADANSVCARYFGESLAIAEMVANLCNLLLGKFSLMIVRTVSLALSSSVSFIAKWSLIATLIRPSKSTGASLINHVLHVLSMSSKPEVVGVYAKPIVTGMADFFTCLNFTNKMLVGKSVWSHKDSGFSRFNVEATVSVSTDTSTPEPTRIGLINMPQPTFISSFIHNLISPEGGTSTIQKMGGIV